MQTDICHRYWLLLLLFQEELVAWLMEAYPENARIAKYGKLLVKVCSECKCAQMNRA